MGETTTVRVGRSTHDELKRLAERHETTVAACVARGVRLLRQEEMGRDLREPLDRAETDWLDAELG